MPSACAEYGLASNRRTAPAVISRMNLPNQLTLLRLLLTVAFLAVLFLNAPFSGTSIR